MIKFLTRVLFAALGILTGVASAQPIWDWNAINSKLECTQPAVLPNGAINDNTKNNANLYTAMVLIADAI